MYNTLINDELTCSSRETANREFVFVRWRTDTKRWIFSVSFITREIFQINSQTVSSFWSQKMKKFVAWTNIQATFLVRFLCVRQNSKYTTQRFSLISSSLSSNHCYAARANLLLLVWSVSLRVWICMVKGLEPMSGMPDFGHVEDE